VASVLAAPKLVAETRTDTFDFSPYLAAGQTISAASAAISVYSGTDPTPSAVLGTVSATSPYAYVKLTGGVVGVIYQLRVDVVTVAPAGTLSLSCYLAVIPDLP
jgi:hypothetical protein